jgi:hypothetical protein
MPRPVVVSWLSIREAFDAIEIGREPEDGA